MSTQVYQRITDQVCALLERGVVPWHKPWAGAEQHPRNLASGQCYRGVNPFLLGVTSWAKGYESPYWLTFKQAQQRGGYIRKGEKATAVVFYKQWSIEDRDRETGEPCHKSIPLLRWYSVFNVAQTAEVEYPKPELASIRFEPIARCESVVAGMPQAPKMEHSGHRACYSPADDIVRMPQAERFESAEAYYATLFHELTHSTGHKSRLDRPGIVKPTGFGSAEYASEELIAEMGAAFLCGHCAIESATIDNSASYIDGWLARLRRDNKLVIRAASAAQKASDFILNHTQSAESAAEGIPAMPLAVAA